MQTFILSGRIGNLKTKETKTGDMMVTFGVAHEEKVKGEQTTEWFNCITFGKRAELLDRLKHAISKIAVTGKVQQRSYEDKTTVQVLVNEFDLTFKPKTDADHQATAAKTEETAYASDEIPF